MTRTIPVTVENFVRAETDHYFDGIVRKHGFGRFEHDREPTPVEQQTVIRMNRDTLYSGAVFDLDAGPVSITLPDTDGRFMSMQIIDEDQYTHDVVYDRGPHQLLREEIGTRYVLAAVRTLVDPRDAKDLLRAHALQDAIVVEQPDIGAFEIPAWDEESQERVRDALLVLGSTLPDSRHAFGDRDDVDPVRFLIGAALGWGGNPETEATYVQVVPERNDGRTPHELTVRDVPVDGFWSISVYNADGYFEPNLRDVYSVNSVTAVRDAEGSVTVRFGGCDGSVPNCIPITPGWNYLVRLYRPHAEVLEGRWTFPVATPVGEAAGSPTFVDG